MTQMEDETVVYTSWREKLGLPCYVFLLRYSAASVATTVYNHQLTVISMCGGKGQASLTVPLPSQELTSDSHPDLTDWYVHLTSNCVLFHFYYLLRHKVGVAGNALMLRTGICFTILNSFNISGMDETMLIKFGKWIDYGKSHTKSKNPPLKGAWSR